MINKLLIVLCIGVIVLLLYLNNHVIKEGLDTIFSPKIMYDNMKNVDVKAKKNILYYILDIVTTFYFTNQGLHPRMVALTKSIFKLPFNYIISIGIFIIIYEIVRDESPIRYSTESENDTQYSISLIYVIINLEPLLSLIPGTEKPSTSINVMNSEYIKFNTYVTKISNIIKNIGDVNTNINDIAYNDAYKALNDIKDLYLEYIK